MRIKNLHIKNLRSFKDQTINFDKYTSLVGPNGAGKSNILCALNILFREIDGASTNLSDLDAEDFHERDTTTPIEITVTFCDLSQDAQGAFSQYFRQNELVITARATYDASTGKATVKQYGQRRVMEEFRKFFECYNSGVLVPELRIEYNQLKKRFPDLPSISTKDGMRDGLRAYEEANADRCVLIPSEDQFYGFSKGSNLLAKYVQWIYVPAVKDATKENVEARNTALGKILARTVRSKVNFDNDVKQLRDETLEKYRSLLQSQQSSLDAISRALTLRLAEWAHPDANARLEWSEDPKRSIQVEEPVARLLAGDGSFNGELARFGHGLQRSYLLALLQELAFNDDPQSPTLLLGCEEPELYQHPPQARHLASVLQKLSASNAQVIVSTHSPYFVSGRYFESLRMVRRDAKTKRSCVASVGFDTIAIHLASLSGRRPEKPAAQEARLQQALQPHLNEMFFAPKVILVEGLEDAAYITSWLILSDRWDEFRRWGAHIVPVNGKSYMTEPTIIAQCLSIPVFAIFDADGGVTNEHARPKHEKDNKELLTLLGGDPNQPFPTDAVWTNRFVQWPTNLGDVLKKEVGQVSWDQTFGDATKGLGRPHGSFAKNPVHIGDHLVILRKKGIALPSLEKLANEIIRFAAAN